MQIKSFRHKGLKQLYEVGTSRAINSAMYNKLRTLLFAIETASSLDNLEKFPGWKLHPLKGDLKGYWSLTVTGNWRLIFRYDEIKDCCENIDLIDYHGR